MKTTIDKRYKYIFFSVLTGLLLSHGMMLFNKYAVHDESHSLFGVGGTYELGRWGLEFVSKIVTFLFEAESSSGLYSLPIMAGIYTCLFVTLSVCLIVKLFDIKNKFLCSLLALLFISSPYFASLFGYTYTMAYYMFSFFLSILGGYLICFYKKWKFFILGILTIIFSLSIYQAYFSFSISLMLIYFIKKILEEKNTSWKTFFLTGSRYLTAIICALGIYFLLNTLICHITNIPLSDYKGLNKMGTESVLTYTKRIWTAYQTFFISNNSIFNYANIKVLYYLLLIIMGGMIALKTFSLLGKNKSKTVQFLLLTALIPLALNFIFLTTEKVHILMIYSQIMFFVFMIVLYQSKILYFKKAIYGIISLIFCLIILMQIRTNNIIYLRLEFLQTRMISYFSTLVTRIKSVEGYKSSYPVVYVNEFMKRDTNLKELPFHKYNTLPYWRINRMINNYSWQKFMNIWCGYNPYVIKNSSLKNIPEVREMPRYPNDGSIKVIYDHVIVKF